VAVRRFANRFALFLAVLSWGADARLYQSYSIACARCCSPAQSQWVSSTAESQRSRQVTPLTPFWNCYVELTDQCLFASLRVLFDASVRWPRSVVAIAHSAVRARDRSCRRSRSGVTPQQRQRASASLWNRALVQVPNRELNRTQALVPARTQAQSLAQAQNRAQSHST
jgi:hypothetical protein